MNIRFAWTYGNGVCSGRSGGIAEVAFFSSSFLILYCWSGFQLIAICIKVNTLDTACECNVPANQLGT